MINLSRPDPCSVWILTAKLTNSDLNFLAVDFSSCVFQAKRPKQIPSKNPTKKSPGTLFGKIPLGFLQKPCLENVRRRSCMTTEKGKGGKRKGQPDPPPPEKSHLPSDTKLVLAKNDSEITIFGKSRISRVIPCKCLYFLDMSRAQNLSKFRESVRG